MHLQITMIFPLYTFKLSLIIKHFEMSSSLYRYTVCFHCSVRLYLGTKHEVQLQLMGMLLLLQVIKERIRQMENLIKLGKNLRKTFILCAKCHGNPSNNCSSTFHYIPPLYQFDLFTKRPLNCNLLVSNCQNQDARSSDTFQL